MDFPGPSPAPKSPLTESTIVPPIPTPSYPTSGSWSVLTTTTIHAPLSIVLAISLENSNWSKWNSMVSQTTPIPPTSSSAKKLEVGAQMSFHSRMKLNGPRSSANSDHEIVFIDEFEKEGRKAASIVWKTIGLPLGAWLMTAERVQEFVEIEIGEGKVGTEYKTWGTFGGPLAYLLTWSGTREDIRERFGDWAGDLKAFAEKE